MDKLTAVLLKPKLDEIPAKSEGIFNFSSNLITWTYSHHNVHFDINFEVIEHSSLKMQVKNSALMIRFHRNLDNKGKISLVKYLSLFTLHHSSKLKYFIKHLYV